MIGKTAAFVSAAVLVIASAAQVNACKRPYNWSGIFWSGIFLSTHDGQAFAGYAPWTLNADFDSSASSSDCGTSFYHGNVG